MPRFWGLAATTGQGSGPLLLLVRLAVGSRDYRDERRAAGEGMRRVPPHADLDLSFSQCLSLVSVSIGLLFCL